MTQEVWISLRLKGEMDETLTKEEVEQRAQHLLAMISDHILEAGQVADFSIRLPGDILEVEVEDDIYEAA